MHEGPAPSSGKKDEEAEKNLQAVNSKVMQTRARIKKCKEEVMTIRMKEWLIRSLIKRNKSL